MREIKFRLHDKSGEIIGYENHEKNQHNCYQILQTSLRGDFADTDTMNVRDGFFIASTHKCQFTGLKDKKGKEIYEGDVLVYGRDYFEGEILNKGNYPLEVIFGDVYASFQLRHPKDKYGIPDLRTDMMHNFEILGNIHENPELI